MTLKELREFVASLGADGEYPFSEDAEVLIETKFGPLRIDAMFCTAAEVYIQALKTPIVAPQQGKRHDN